MSGKGNIQLELPLAKFVLSKEGVGEIWEAVMKFTVQGTDLLILSSQTYDYITKHLFTTDLFALSIMPIF